MTEEDLFLECFTNNLPLWGSKACLRRRVLRFILSNAGQGTSQTYTESESPQLESGSEEDFTDSNMQKLDDALLNPDIENAVIDSEEDDVEEVAVNMEEALLNPDEPVAVSSSDENDVEGVIVEEVNEALVQDYNYDELPNDVVLNMPEEYFN